MFAVAHAEGVLSKVEDELYAFGMALGQHTDLRDALTDASLPTENKKAMVHDVLGDRANPVTVSLLGFVIDAGRAREIPKIVEELARMASAEREHALAEVRSAVELTSRQRDRLAQALSAATGRKVEREGGGRPERHRRRGGAGRRRGLRRLHREPARGRQAGLGACTMALDIDPKTSRRRSGGTSRAEAPVEREEVGRVTETATASRASQGLPRAMANELLEFPGGVLGLAFNLDEDEIGCVILGESDAHRGGRRGQADRPILSVPVGDGFLGRVVDALGRPLDGKGPIRRRDSRNLEVQAPNVV